jgi:hypothetical protein
VPAAARALTAPGSVGAGDGSDEIEASPGDARRAVGELAPEKNCVSALGLACWSGGWLGKVVVRGAVRQVGVVPRPAGGGEVAAAGLPEQQDALGVEVLRGGGRLRRLDVEEGGRWGLRSVRAVASVQVGGHRELSTIRSYFLSK